MPTVEATLVKRYVDQTHETCGMPLMELEGAIPLGKVYRVKLETRGMKRLYSREHNLVWRCEMIEDADHPNEWLPVELLRRDGMAL